MTDTEREALCKRIDELCQENERLRELADGAANEADRLTHDATALQIENAKLRMLLLDVWNDACEFDGFWDYVNDNGEIYDKDVLPHYQERMQELGIEVYG